MEYSFFCEGLTSMRCIMTGWQVNWSNGQYLNRIYHVHIYLDRSAGRQVDKSICNHIHSRSGDLSLSSFTFRCIATCLPTDLYTCRPVYIYVQSLPYTYNDLPTCLPADLYTSRPVYLSTGQCLCTFSHVGICRQVGR